MARIGKTIQAALLVLRRDAVLRSFGTLLKDFFRAEDIVCRYGGEEFTVILPKTSLEAATKRASGLCVSTKQMVVQHRREVLRPVTIFIGVAIPGDHGTTTASLLSAADSALYQAKEQGRDRVTTADTRDRSMKSSPIISTYCETTPKL